MTEYICTKCGYEGRRKTKKRGSTTMEVLLWVVFFFPGPFYSLWRIFSKEYICPMCEEKTMVSVTSALGKRKLDILEAEISGNAPLSTTEKPEETSAIDRLVNDKTPEADKANASPQSHTKTETKPQPITSQPPSPSHRSTNEW